MGKIKFKLNRKGVQQLLKSVEIQSVLSEHGQKIKNRCGDGFDTSLYIGKNRANVSVMAETKSAIKDNSRNNTLLKALRG